MKGRRNEGESEAGGGGVAIPLLPTSFSSAVVVPAATSSSSGDVKIPMPPSGGGGPALTHLPKRPRVDIAFSDLRYTVKEGAKKKEKLILKSVSGRLRSGELTAIMGPSGAGKSTLLNILTGYKTTGMEGSITINGRERDLSQFRKLSAYIMQDNQLHANLTVEEAMGVAASLKLAQDVSSDKKAIMIQEILETLGLQEHRATMTGSLSGGQKKRLSIALELVSNPPIMFFDEPTSGLDSSSCFQCISLLKYLALGGRTIICTIHQPSARLFEKFDHLYTLADGQCVYQGSTTQLVPFLATLDLVCPSYHNPASFIIEVSCGEYGDHVKKLVDAIENGKNDIHNGIKLPEVKHVGDGGSKSKQPNGSSARDRIESVNLYEEQMDKGDKFAKGEQAEKNLALINLSLATNDILKAPLAVPEGSLEVIVEPSPKGVDAGQAGDVDGKPEEMDTLLDASEIVSSKAYPTSGFTQFWIVLKRTLLFSRRDWTLMYLRLFAHILVGFLIGALYYDIGNDGAKVLSNLGFLFFNMLFLMYTSMTITILSFPLEMPVLVKENFNRWYSLKSYYAAITLSDLPFQAVFCVVYVTIVYFLTSQPAEGFRFGMFLSACLMISFVAQSIGLVVGAAMNVQNGVFLAPVMSVPFLLFSGFFVSFDAIPIYLRWITYLSYIRYGFEGTALATYAYGRERLKCHQVYCHFKSPETTLEELDMTNGDFMIDIIALVVIFFVLRCAAYVFLRWKLMSTR
ncbi:ATP-binding cassette sub-family G member 1 [Ischnura elegans]|uniref:ATP-binding cassette sub-family G member 1 n=1 Tax=Ischnura elegans TaxID=197161 RepID=UPI001ED86F91|nr:ATP-binding cassette sub-family G member 1 [Ischnura elegans]XP_046387517.1 ATP-binding cassette sub-family G member 1 [Ischnura elegans]XP_046387518.1 ATP-binding cassette sub-family G member 1 [Ischnura elegans]